MPNVSKQTSSFLTLPLIPARLNLTNVVNFYFLKMCWTFFLMGDYRQRKWARSIKTDIAGQSANLRSTVADKNKKINGGNKNKNLTSATWVCYPAPHLQQARQYCRLSICFIWVCIWICCLYLIRSTEATSNTDFLNIPKPQNISIFSPKYHHPNIASKLFINAL